MPSYLCMKVNNSTKSYELKTSANKPYLRIGGGYLALTTETGTGLKVKANNTTYKIVETYTVSSTSTYLQSYTYTGSSSSTNSVSVNTQTTKTNKITGANTYMGKAVQTILSNQAQKEKISLFYLTREVTGPYRCRYDFRNDTAAAYSGTSYSMSVFTSSNIQFGLVDSSYANTDSIAYKMIPLFNMYGFPGNQSSQATTEGVPLGTNISSASTYTTEALYSFNKSVTLGATTTLAAAASLYRRILTGYTYTEARTKSISSSNSYQIINTSTQTLTSTYITTVS